MNIHISTQDGVPIYRQIIQQVKLLVTTGQLQTGVELPSIRTLAQQLLINPNTVARAYRDLETAGVIISKQGSGTLVADIDQNPLARQEKKRILSERIDSLLSEATQMGVEVDTLMEWMDSRSNQLNPKKELKK
jgi:GntR family transcriptional regulator